MNDFVPKISVIMPCLNEETYITKAVEGLIDDFFIETCEIIIVDGRSADKTLDEIRRLIEKGYRIRLIHNEKKLQNFALNLGIKSAQGEIIARADAHCIYPSGYLKKCYELLEREKADNAGGMFYPVGETPRQKEIAWAMRHPFGNGGCKFKIENYRGYAEGTYLGMYRKEIFNKIGYFDTTAKTNEDSELNIRLLKSGGKIFVDTSIKVIYRPRKTIRALARQFFNYGIGRCNTTLKHKTFTAARQLGPVIIVPLMVVSLGLSFVHVAFLAVPLLYGLTVLTGSFLYRYGERVSFKSRLIIAICIIVMHFSWGVGFLKRLISPRTGTA